MMTTRGNSPALADAIHRVQNGDKSAYGIIHDITDEQLRGHISFYYGHRGPKFLNEVAVLTQEYGMLNIDKYDPTRGAYQTWLNLKSHNVANKLKAEQHHLRKIRCPDGRRHRVPMTVSMTEDALVQAAGTVPGPEELHDARWQEHLLYKELNALAREGRLSITLHIMQGKTQAEAAAMLKMPVITLRRIIDRDLRRMRKRLLRQGFQPTERVLYYGRVWHGPDDTGSNNDWTSSQTAPLPVEPDSRSGTEAQEIEDVEKEVSSD